MSTKKKIVNRKNLEWYIKASRTYGIGQNGDEVMKRWMMRSFESMVDRAIERTRGKTIQNDELQARVDEINAEVEKILESAAKNEI
jgi:hypothetical protein